MPAADADAAPQRCIANFPSDAAAKTGVITAGVCEVKVLVSSTIAVHVDDRAPSWCIANFLRNALRGYGAPLAGAGLALSTGIANFLGDALAKRGVADNGPIPMAGEPRGVCIQDFRAASRCPRPSCPRLQLAPLAIELPLDPPTWFDPDSTVAEDIELWCAAIFCSRCSAPQYPGQTVLVCAGCSYWLCIPCRDTLASNRASWMPRRWPMDTG